MVMYDANILCAHKYFKLISNFYLRKFWNKSFCNNVCSIYVIYYFFVNQMLVYKKSIYET